MNKTVTKEKIKLRLLMERIAQSMAEEVCVHTEDERHLTKESGWDDLRDKTSKRVEGIEETRKRVAG